MKRETITVKEIIADLPEINESTLRSWIYNDVSFKKRQQGDDKRCSIFLLKDYNLWKKNTFPAKRKKYLSRKKARAKISAEDLAALCYEITGVKRDAQAWVKWVYSYVPHTASREGIITWFESEPCKKIMAIMPWEKSRWVDETFVRPCGQAMKIGTDVRCENYLKCAYTIDCLDFFTDIRWFGWAEA